MQEVFSSQIAAARVLNNCQTTQAGYLCNVSCKSLPSFLKHLRRSFALLQPERIDLSFPPVQQQLRSFRHAARLTGSPRAASHCQRLWERSLNPEAPDSPCCKHLLPKQWPRTCPFRAAILSFASPLLAASHAWQLCLPRTPRCRCSRHRGSCFGPLPSQRRSHRSLYALQRDLE